MSQPFISTAEKIELTNFKLNKSGYYITLSLMYLMICIPVLAFIFIVSSGNKPAIGLFVFAVALGFGAYFFYRLAVWNKYGKENFILTNDSLIYKPEAKNISYKEFEFKIEDLVVSIIDTKDHVEYEGMRQTIAWLKLTDGQNTIETNIKTPKSVLIELTKVFDEWGIQNYHLLGEIKD